jgi:hypothetical protein
MKFWSELQITADSLVFLLQFVTNFLYILGIAILGFAIRTGFI